MTARQHDPVAMIRCRATAIHPLDRLRKLRKLGVTFPMSRDFKPGNGGPITCQEAAERRSAGARLCLSPLGGPDAPAPGATVSERPAGVRE
eukprot:505693-Hanusia_phi.AAC.1